MQQKQNMARFVLVSIVINEMIVFVNRIYKKLSHANYLFVQILIQIVFIWSLINICAAFGGEND